VDIGEDDVVRRRRDIDRRLAIDRDRHEVRLRQDEQPDRHDRRCQDDKIRRRWRQEKHRCQRRRRKVELRVVESKYGAVDIDNFIGRRWRHVVVDHRE
jgi:hypothetical protein